MSAGAGGGAAAAAESRRLPGWLLVLFVALLATGTDEFVIAGVLPAVADDLGVSVSAAGQLVTVFAVVYALGAPLLSLVTDRYPRRAVIVIGLLVFAAANAMAALAPGYWPLMVARVLAALGAATVTSAAFATTAAGAPEGRQGRYLAVVVAGMTAALFTGVPAGTWLAGAYGWRATFWLITGIGAVAAVGVRATAPRVAGGAPAPLAERLAPLRSMRVLRLLAVTFLCGTGGMMFYNYLAPFTGAVAGDSHTLLVTLLLVVGLTGIGGAWLGGRGTDTLGPPRALSTVVAGHAVALAGAALLAFSGWGNAWALGAVIAVWSVFAWALSPPLQGVLLAVAPRAAMTAMALNISALYLGTGAGGALGGLLLEAADPRWIPVASVALLATALALIPRRAGATGRAVGTAGESAVGTAGKLAGQRSEPEAVREREPVAEQAS